MPASAAARVAALSSPLRAIRALVLVSEEKATATMDSRASVHNTTISAMPLSRLTLDTSAYLISGFLPGVPEYWLNPICPHPITHPFNQRIDKFAIARVKPIPACLLDIPSGI